MKEVKEELEKCLKEFQSKKDLFLRLDRKARATNLEMVSLKGAIERLEKILAKSKKSEG